MSWRRAALWAGIVGPALFIATFSIEGALRSGYDPRSMFVSELALGPRGWIQALNFWILGALLVAFAVGVASAMSTRAVPILLAIIGICLFASGIATMDPVDTPRELMSLSGRLHDLFGALVFSLAPVTCFVFAWTVRADPSWRGFQRWTLLAGVVTLLVVVGMSMRIDGWQGIVQRTHLVTFLAWVSTLAWRLLQLRRS
jgi:hypothetical membrane protein